MKDFLPSFQKGITAAQNAEKNRDEIDSVFSALNEQLAAATEGKVGISRKKYEHPIDFTKNTLLQMLERKTYWALVVDFIPNATVPPIQIARWDQSFTGFPCRVVFGNREYSCEDKAGLEGVLELLLADPEVGNELLKFMNRPLLDTSE